MSDASRVSVACEPEGGGWRCRVTVGDDASATVHDVTVGADDVAQLAAPGAAPEALVAASFEFLLEREPRESILRAFAMADIGRYFPAYSRVIRQRMGA